MALNIQEYIASGILERYALGQCNEEEIASVEKALIQFPVLAEELQQIENALFLYAKTQEVTPPSRVKKNVLAQIEKQSYKDTPAVSMVKSKNYSNWIAAASIVLLAGSIWMNFRLSQKNNSLQQEIASLQNQNSEVAGNLEFTKTGLSQSQQIVTLLSDTSTKVITLKDVPSGQKSKALAYWNVKTQEVFVSATNLDILDSSLDYQLWAIIDGKPVDAGILKITNEYSLPQKMISFATAQAFAITIEKKGGSDVPTLDKMVALGGV